MTLVDAGSYAVHLLFAAFWTGSVLFVSYAVLPLARDGDLNATPLGAVTGKLRTVSRVSAVVLFLTGGHMAASRYTFDTLTARGGGHLVLTMILLWAVLAALVEIGASKLADGTGKDKVREPARDARRFFQGASLVAVLLLVNAGLIVSNGLGLLTL